MQTAVVCCRHSILYCRQPGFLDYSFEPSPISKHQLDNIGKFGVVATNKRNRPYGSTADHRILDKLVERVSAQHGIARDGATAAALSRFVWFRRVLPAKESSAPAARGDVPAVRRLASIEFEEALTDFREAIEKLTQRAQKTQHGFKDIQNAADDIVASNGNEEGH